MAAIIIRLVCVPVVPGAGCGVFVFLILVIIAIGRGAALVLLVELVGSLERQRRAVRALGRDGVEIGRVVKFVAVIDVVPIVCVVVEIIVVVVVRVPVIQQILFSRFFGNRPGGGGWGCAGGR
ncbi:MAG: hypothetical protein ACK5HY_04700 [Parahaliea sp.]